MSLYKVQITVWPHSTGRGKDIDQKQAGAQKQEYEVRAEGIYDALQISETICLGITQNPIVWQAFVNSIVEQGNSGNSSRHIARCLTERGEAYIE